MLIKEMFQPDIAAIRDIRELETICKRHEVLRGTISLDQAMNFNPEIKSFYLLYEEEKLVSVLSLFIPTPAAAEVSAYTAPEKRSQGHFTALMERAVTELKRHNIPELLLVCESGSQSGKAVLARLEASYRFTEYLMCYENASSWKSTESLQGRTPDFTWKRAVWEDLEELIPAGMRIFGDNEADSRSMLVNTLKSADREEWVARWDGPQTGPHVRHAGIPTPTHFSSRARHRTGRRLCVLAARCVPNAWLMLSTIGSSSGCGAASPNASAGRCCVGVPMSRHGSGC